MDLAQRLQVPLLQETLAPWLHKGAAVLDINCGDGRFLPALLENGCNVDACEADPALRGQAHVAGNGRVDVVAATGDHLPWGDNYFDYALAHLTAEDVDKLPALVAEMARVAERGIAVTFWNSASLGALGDFAGLALVSLPWWRVRSALKGLGSGAYCARSTLCLPAGTWKAQDLAAANSLCSCLPVGAWMVARLDLRPRQTGTPLTLRIPFLRQGNTAMTP